MNKALHERPWLPRLPTEFYDRNILERIGNHLGTLLRIDTSTSAALRDRYARICIQVPLDVPVKKFVIVGTHRQTVVYEKDGVLCTGCRRLGHTTATCANYIAQTSNNTQEPNNCTPSTSKEIGEAEEWQTVKFSKRKQTNKATQNTQEGIESHKNNHTQVKVYNASTGKFLNQNPYMPVAETVREKAGNINTTNKEPLN
ncbi:hypothetical protein P3S68_020217 [Capsicum galapagoense]